MPAVVAKTGNNSGRDSGIQLGVLIFLMGAGFGATAGWQAACYLYRTEDARKAVRARLGMYVGLSGGFLAAAALAVTQLARPQR
mmetsp:Transcript_112847/g.324309  ORF Transcript_112847/g.324309 Transcript_112847/m.324309 type:complete len:84 (+) Transcript_112847:114-365(+)